MTDLNAIAHRPNDDCAYLFGRECDCREPDDLRERLTKAGLLVVSEVAHRALLDAAEIGLKPRGDHALINVYCPNCGGSCLKGFGNPVR